MGFSLRKFEVNNWTFESPKIKKETTMVVISDLHECEFGDNNCRLFATIKELDPDCIVIAGDLIEAGRNADCTRTMQFLKQLSDNFPVYFGVGNHERKVFEMKKYVAQQKRLVKGLQEAGVGLIRNEYFDLPESNIRITGLDLERTHYHKVTRIPVPAEHLLELLDNADESKYNILLAHNPEHFEDYVTWKPDLVLSGHVHGGIIRLFGKGIISPAYKLFPKYDGGLFEKDDTKMLLSRGAGSHSINLRIFNRPEILYVTLRPILTDC